jgi:hypothetical protein
MQGGINAIQTSESKSACTVRIEFSIGKSDKFGTNVQKQLGM